MTRRYTLEAAIVVIGFVLRVESLRQPHWLDEQITARIIRQHGFFQLITWVPANQPHFPTFYLLLKALTWTPLSVWQLRWLSIFTGTMTIIVVLYWTHREYSRDVSLMSGLLVSTSPMLVIQSAWLRMYALFALATVCSMILLFHALQADSRQAWMVWFVGIVVVVCLHPFGLLLLAAQLAYLLVRSRIPRHLVVATSLVGVPGGLLLAVKILNIGHIANANIHLIYPPSLLKISLLPGALVFGRLFNFSQFATLPLLAVCLYLGVRELRARGNTLIYAAWLGVPIVLVVAASYLIRPCFQVKYLVWLAIPLSVLVALGIDTRPRRQKPVILTVFITIQLLILAYFDFHSPWLALRVFT